MTRIALTLGTTLGLGLAGLVGDVGPAHAQDGAEDVVGAGGEADLQVHGFVSQGFMLSTGNNYLGKSGQGSFEFFEAGLNVSKELRPDLRVGLQVFAQDLGPIGNYAPVIDWAMVDWRIRPWLGVRAGRVKMPLGIYNENWDVDVSRTPVLLPASVYEPRFRDVINAVNGASVYGLVDLGAGGALDYSLFAGSVYIPPHVGDFDFGNIVGGRVLWETPLAGLRLGGHVARAEFKETYQLDPMTSADLHYDGWLMAGGSAEYVRGPLTLTAEYRSWSSELNWEPMVLEAGHYHTDGVYAMAQLQANERLSFSAYYSLNFDDAHDREDPDDFARDAALGARFDVTANWIIKLEGHYIDGKLGLSGDLNPDGEDRHWGLFVAKTSLAF